jgi:hypothetical protein
MVAAELDRLDKIVAEGNQPKEPELCTCLEELGGEKLK